MTSVGDKAVTGDASLTSAITRPPEITETPTFEGISCRGRVDSSAGESLGK